MKITLPFGFRLEIRRPRPATPVASGKPPAKPETEASSEFWDAFSGGGGIIGQCSCGRIVFPADTTLDYEDGELEGLLQKAKENPDRYIVDYENDSIGMVDLYGKIFCWGCPCRGARVYEEFIWQYRRKILDYYARRHRARRLSAEEMDAALKKAAGVAE